MSDQRDPGAPPLPQAGTDAPFGVGRGDRLHEFSANEIRVTWSRSRCIHVAACVMNLPKVFAPGRRPWVDANQASADAIARVIQHCPTGALHFERTDGGPAEVAPSSNTVVVTRDGPLNLRGDLEVFDEAGERHLADFRASLCRCGGSQNKPFCDGSHVVKRFRDDGSVPVGTPLVCSDAVDAKLRARPEPEGPLHLEGPLTLESPDRRTMLAGNGAVLCRCGGSARKPFCDGSHRRRERRATAEPD